MAERYQAGTVDLNRVLMVLNAIIAALTALAFIQLGGNDYLDGESVVLALVLSLQTQVALMVERRRRDPFMILLAFILILYFSLRLYTLLLFPFSFVLDRYPYAPADSNRALVFILIANLFLYAGLLAVRGGERLRISPGDWWPTAPRRALGLVVLTILFIYTRGSLWSTDSLPRALQFLTIFLSQSIVLLMALAYYVLFHKTFRRSYAIFLLGLLVLEMVLHSLAGSRSAIIYSIQNVIVVLLAADGAVTLRRKHVLVGVVLTPVASALLIASFTVSTFVRASSAAGQAFSVSSAIELARAGGDRLSREYVLESGVPVMFARAGFFDYSAEVIAHAGEYANVVNVPAYARSIVDNLLTPGFDVFDQPKISNALIFDYGGLGTVSKAVVSTAYQSDQLGIYGELFLLFGYGSFPLFFVVGFFAKRVYVALRARDPFVLAMQRTVLLSIFVVVVNSFGLDWALMDLIPLVAAVYIYRYFFAVAPLGPLAIIPIPPTPSLDA